MPVDDADFCRVCRCEASPSQPLFHPCICTGSIKYVHQDCLLQWLHYSKRKTCELCGHRFTFRAVYASNMPPVVPPGILMSGVVTALRNVVFRCLHFLAVIVSWLIVVPLTVCRIYKCFFSGSIVGLLSLPVDILSTENILFDCVQGLYIVMISVAASLGYVWLREHLAASGEPDWLTEVLAEGEDEEEVAVARDEAAHLPDPVNPVDANPPQPDGVLEQANNAVVEAANPLQNHNNNNNGGDGVGEEDGGFGGVFGGAGGAAMGNPLTWERIFGLDGTMIFLEHALWLIALNVFFIILFAVIPFFSGRALVSLFGVETAVLTTQVEAVLFSFVGYCLMACFLMTIHKLCKALRMPKTSYYAGLSYVYIKVAIVAFLELGVFTAFCGLWIDACSLSMFNASLTQRYQAFNFAPMVFVFIHWTMGVMYLLYISALFVLIRDILRPGVLWFLPDFNDPDFKPFQEMLVGWLLISSIESFGALHLEVVNLPIMLMLTLSMMANVQRLVVNFSLTGIAVIVSLWVPSRICQKVLPGFLPFRFSLAYDSPVDYSVEIILLQIVMPFVLDGQFRVLISALLRHWCVAAAWIFGLRSYLLGDVAHKEGDLLIMADGQETPFRENQPQGPAEEADGGGGAGDDAEAGAAVGYTPYARPRTLFHLRLAGLLVFLVISVVVLSLAILVVPVAHGRNFLQFVGIGQPPHHDALTLLFGMLSLVGWAKTIMFLPSVLGFLRKACYAVSAVFVHLTRWEGYNWLSEWSLALGHWLRGHSFRPHWRGVHDALAVTLPPLPPHNAGESSEAAWRRRRQLLHQVVVAASVPFRLALVAAALLILLPAALGLLVNLVVFVPTWVNPEKTLVLGFSENWIFGVMHLKVWMLFLLLGPRWRMRDRLEEMHDELLHNWPAIHSLHLLHQASPLFVAIGLSLSTPYLAAHYIAPKFDVPEEDAFRYIYPLAFAIVVLGAVFCAAAQQCAILYEHIRDAEYLIGRRLENYSERKKTASSTETGTQTDHPNNIEPLALGI